MSEWDAVSLVQALIRTESLSGQEGAVADLVEDAMRSLGFRDICRDAFGDVVGFVGPRGDTSAVLFDAHMDTVPIMGRWSVEPFGAEIVEGRLFGRGATDMKGALGAALWGVAKSALGGGLKRQVAVSASVLEETIEGLALGAVLDRTRPENVVICEPSSLTIKHGQRGRIEIVVEVGGVPAHAAYPDRGKNPLLLAAKALTSIEAMALPTSVEFGPAIMVPTDIVSIPYPSVSSIPAGVEIRFDRRTLPGETTSDVLASLQLRLAEIDAEAFALRVTDDPVTAYTGKVSRAVRELPAWLFDRSLPLVQAAAQSVIDAGRAAEFGYYSFCTNGSETAGRRKIPTVGFGPGNEADSHTADESISVAEVELASEVYCNLSIALAGTRP